MEQLVGANSLPNQAAFEIDGWSVEPSTLRMRRAGKTVRLEPKVMAVLEYLASRRGKVVSRRDLEENIWAGTVVGYDAISNAIIKLRKAFGDDAHNPAIIETIPRAGYRLIAAVEGQAEQPDTVSEPVTLSSSHGKARQTQAGHIRRVGVIQTAWNQEGRFAPVHDLVAKLHIDVTAA